MAEFIARKRRGKQYQYFLDNKHITDTHTVGRINKLAIPPAWGDVQIAVDPADKVQATGYDGAGRKQAIYHSDFRAEQDAAKFERILRFADNLPKLRRRLDKDMRARKLTKDKVVATAVKLIDEAYFRPGNDTYAKQHQTYGITTMRSKHVDITTTSVTFDFVGKSGQHHHKKISDRQIANIIKQLDELPGYDLFRYIGEDGNTYPVNSQHVNEYIKETMGDDYTAKDFRTWGGTLIAASNLAIEKRAKSDHDRKRSITVAVKKVAARLGNTPAVARSSYIDPRVIEAYMNGDALSKVYDTIARMKPQKYLKNEERAVIKLLRSV